MARIIVTAEPASEFRGPSPSADGQVLFDERVNSIHLQDDHAAEQLIERLAWAVTDAEEAEGRRAALAR